MKTTWMEVVFFSVYKMSGCESKGSLSTRL